MWLDDVVCDCNKLERDSLKDRLRHEHNIKPSHSNIQIFTTSMSKP
jgi:hypothetical protein